MTSGQTPRPRSGSEARAGAADTRPPARRRLPSTTRPGFGAAALLLALSLASGGTYCTLNVGRVTLYVINRFTVRAREVEEHAARGVLTRRDAGRERAQQRGQSGGPAGPSSARAVPPGLLSQLEGEGWLTHQGWFKCKVYNGSSWKILSVTVLIIMPGTARLYRMPLSVGPLDTAEGAIEVFGLDSSKPPDGWSWWIVSARGYPGE